MNNPYEIGKSYKLEYLNTIEINDRKFLCVTDGEHDYTVIPYDFQIDWPDQNSNFLQCYVKDITINGKPLFVQDRYAVLKNRYPHLNQNHTFFIKNILTESNGDIKGYILSDPFGITHYIPGRIIQRDVSVGDPIDLLVEDIIVKTKNNSSLKLCTAAAHHQSAATRATDKHYSRGIDSVGLEEGAEVEFKTSIVYLAGTSEPNADAQGKVIIQTIAGFMNSNGGKLLIGVNDNGEIVGFSDDINVLFPNGTTKAHDKYELEIRNRINTMLGPVPNTKVHISFIKGENSGLEYCLVDVNRSDEPVFVAGCHLFVRAGNMTVHFKDNHIVSFIIKRLGLNYTVQSTIVSSAATPATMDNPVENAPESKTTGIEVVPPDVVPNRQKLKKNLVKVHNLNDEEKIIGHLYFLGGGACRFVSTSQESRTGGIPDYVFRTPIPSSPKNYNLLIFYSHGDTDIVSLETALYGTGRNSGKKREGNIVPGWNTELKILDAFCIKKTPKNPYMVAYISILNGMRYLKIHEMSAIATNPHKNFGSKGNTMLAGDADLLYAIPVSGDVDTRRLLEQKALIRPDNYKSRCGTPFDKIEGQYLEILKPLFEAFDEAPATVQPAPEATDRPTQEAAVRTKSKYLYILSENGDILKTMRSGEGTAVDNIPPTYENLEDLCRRHFQNLADDQLRFVQFTCPDDVFNRDLAKAIMSRIYIENQPFLTEGRPERYSGVTIDKLADDCRTERDKVIEIISDGYILTKQSQYPLYNSDGISMVILRKN